MKTINVLPPVIYNRLAAGEVVENPASIVKELIENSLDAGARKITVQITNGGIDEIVVIDDGEGVDENNLGKVFMPHATSKIKDLADIEHITSMGFRGEAMASIASVAKVEFTSKPKSQDYAAAINERNEIKRVGANNGTTVRVSDLFYNTPARKKFLRTANTEKNNVTKVVHNFIFANPNLAVRLVIDNKMVLDYNGQGLLAAMSQIFNVESNEILTVNYSNKTGMKLTGYMSNPHLTKINRERQIMVINGRVISGGLPAAIVNETMTNYLPPKTFPLFVLHLTISPEQVDVNVHPQKKEVRFENKNAVAFLVKQAITQTMDNYFLQQINALATPAVPAATEPDTTTKPKAASPKTATAAPKPLTGFSFNPEHTASTVLLQSLDIMQKESTMLESAPNILNQITLNTMPTDSKQLSALPQRNYTVLGQIFDTYLLVRTPDALLIVDQHAMAERINYDQFRHQIDNGEVKSQILLVPMLVKLTPNELSKFEQIKPLLTAFGFECDQFGENAIRIIAIPAIMEQKTVNEFMNFILNDKEIIDTTLSETIKHKVATNACKASIRAGDVLSTQQIEYFLDHYFATKNVPLCPHGRPIMMTYTKSKLESLFARK